MLKAIGWGHPFQHKHLRWPNDRHNPVVSDCIRTPGESCGWWAIFGLFLLQNDGRFRFVATQGHGDGRAQNQCAAHAGEWAQMLAEQLDAKPGA